MRAPNTWRPQACAPSEPVPGEGLEKKDRSQPRRRTGTGAPEFRFLAGWGTVPASLGTDKPGLRALTPASPSPRGPKPWGAPAPAQSARSRASTPGAAACRAAAGARPPRCRSPRRRARPQARRNSPPSLRWCWGGCCCAGPLRRGEGGGLPERTAARSCLIKRGCAGGSPIACAGGRGRCREGTMRAHTTQDFGCAAPVSDYALPSMNCGQTRRRLF